MGRWGRGRGWLHGIQSGILTPLWGVEGQVSPAGVIFDLIAVTASASPCHDPAACLLPSQAEGWWQNEPQVTRKVVSPPPLAWWLFLCIFGVVWHLFILSAGLTDIMHAC